MSTSVIIPNFNHGALLRRAVQGHLGQTRTPDEVLIVDDASTDDSLAVAAALVAEDRRVKLIRRAVNGGPNAGIATGLEQARGQFITFAAADDLVEPTFLERSIAALERHPGAAFSFLDPSHVVVGTAEAVKVPLALARDVRYFAPAEFERLLAQNYFTVSSNTVVYRAAAIAGIGGFRTDLEWQADWLANLVLAFRHGVVYVPEHLAHFSVDTASYGERGVRDRSGQQRLLDSFLLAIERDYPDVRDRFRRAGVLPEMRLRDLGWLLATDRGRRFVSPRLATRLCLREVWFHTRRFTPLGLRRWMRGVARPRG